MTIKDKVELLKSYARDMGLKTRHISFTEGDAWQDPYFLIRHETGAFKLSPGSDEELHRQMYEGMLIAKEDLRPAEKLFELTLDIPGVDKDKSACIPEVLGDTVCLRLEIIQNDTLIPITVGASATRKKTPETYLETVKGILARS